MRIFVTGVSGGIGSVVVEELVSHGHEVLGLARTEASEPACRPGGGGVPGELSAGQLMISPRSSARRTARRSCQVRSSSGVSRGQSSTSETTRTGAVLR